MERRAEFIGMDGILIFGTFRLGWDYLRSCTEKVFQMSLSMPNLM